MAKHSNDVLDPPDSEAVDDLASDSTEPATKSKLRARLVPAVGVLLLAASTASAVYFYLQYDEKRDIVDASAAASAAACDYAQELANFDFNTLDPYFAGVLAGATGEWKTQFETRQNDLRNLYTQGQVTSKVTEVQCATVSGDSDTAQALVVIGETISSVATEGKPQAGQLTMKVTLDNVDGRWLVSKLSAPQML